MPPPSETPLRKLASHVLGKPINDWIRERRPPRKSWRAIAEELRIATGGDVDVTIQTLINWAPDPKDDDEVDQTPPATPVQRAAS